MANKFNVVIGCDHAAVDMKNQIAKVLNSRGYTVTDVGTHTNDSCDYPVISRDLCAKIQDGSHKLGILICGTGVGMSIAANKHRGIRAACRSESYRARLSRYHNDANVLCFGARVIGIETALDMVDAFLTAEYEGGRHQKRVDLISNIEKNEAEKI